MHHGYYPKGGQPKSNQQAQACPAAAAAGGWLLSTEESVAIACPVCALYTSGYDCCTQVPLS